MRLELIGDRGQCFSLAWLIDDDGRCYGKEFLARCQGHKQNRTVACFERAKDRLPGHKSLKALRHDMNGFLEIRPTEQIVYFCFESEGVLVITNGCMKRGSVDEPHKTRAKELRARWQAAHERL